MLRGNRMLLFLVMLFSVAIATARRLQVTESTSCNITLQKDLDPKKEPLILSFHADDPLESALVGQLNIAKPEVLNGSGVVHVSDGEELVLACLGERNVNRASGQPLAQLVCEGGNLSVEGRPATPDLIACTSSYAWSWMRFTNSSCADSSQILQLGFQVDDEYIPEVNVCHNIAESNTLFSRHLVLGQSLAGGVKSSIRRKFTRGPKSLYPDVNPDYVYTRTGQEKAFDQILGEAARKQYINDTCFLSRGHLSPDADWVFNSEQLMTYYYVNAAPQYQPFNGGNWLTIETAVRRLAIAANITVIVFTGTYGVLRLPDTEGEEKEIYLEPTKKLLPVPEVYWKLVHDPVTEACTVAVGHNNVFLQEPPSPLCPPVAPSGWPTGNLMNIAHGYTYYCDYQAFAEVVDYALDIQCNELFVFPEKISSDNDALYDNYYNDYI